jgi:hypothetical protein
VATVFLHIMRLLELGHRLVVTQREQRTELHSWKKVVKGTGLGEVVALFCPFALSIYQTLSKFLLQRTAECVQTCEQSTGKERGVSGGFRDSVGDYVILRLCPRLADNSQEQGITVAPFNV